MHYSLNFFPSFSGPEKFGKKVTEGTQYTVVDTKIWENEVCQRFKVAGCTVEAVRSRDLNAVAAVARR